MALIDRPEFAQLKSATHVIGVGVGKCGTTSLWHLLRNHPEVAVASDDIKEYGFFTALNEKETSLEDYFRVLEPRSAGKTLIAGDIHPNYIHDPKAADRILATLGENTKIIILIRDPVDRAISHYRMLRRWGGENLSFQRAILAEPTRPSRLEEGFGWRYVRNGLYSEDVSRFLQKFPAENVKVLVFEDFFGNDSEAEFADLCRWLGIADDQSASELTMISQDRERANVTRTQRKNPNNRAPGTRSQFFEQIMCGIGGNQVLRKFLRKMISSPHTRVKVNRMFHSILSLNETRNRPDTRQQIPIEYRKELFLTKFSDDVSKLESILGRDLEVWRQKYR